ncbi:MAG: hypothetical protein OMM_07989 [Candidatus Magnetoglobus multicellularis str. Araruama]|uniref:Uncharacterized protein n=1 Tax=Candidatus Magnetoglobus multicellularis str. Araruama TaxID=890399 RepID=A0A1V1PA38_9BACT|nr:MAG: hypothetical protein OMM_07989 [Candidatus Magnetoglobus multicellularis str. Araruama]
MHDLISTAIIRCINQWNRDWYINSDDVQSNGGDIRLKFDFVSVGFGEPFDAKYFLIKRDSASGDFSIVDVTPIAKGLSQSTLKILPVLHILPMMAQAVKTALCFVPVITN